MFCLSRAILDRIENGTNEWMNPAYCIREAKKRRDGSLFNFIIQFKWKHWQIIITTMISYDNCEVEKMLLSAESLPRPLGSPRDLQKWVHSSRLAASSSWRITHTVLIFFIQIPHTTTVCSWVIESDSFRLCTRLVLVSSQVNKLHSTAAAFYNKIPMVKIFIECKKSKLNSIDKYKGKRIYDWIYVCRRLHWSRYV